MKMIDRLNLDYARSVMLDMADTYEGTFDANDSKDMAKELGGIARFFEKHPDKWIVGTTRTTLDNVAEYSLANDVRLVGGAGTRFCSIGLRSNLEEIKDIDGSFRTFASQQAFGRAEEFIVGLNDGMHEVGSLVEGLRIMAKAFKLSAKKGTSWETAVNTAFAENTKLLKVQQQRAKARLERKRGQLVNA